MKKLIPSLLAILLLTACGSSTSPKTSTSPTPSKSTNPYGSGFAVDAPADTDVVLTIKGATTKNFTMADMRKLASKTITIVEPFIKKTQTFRVVKMQDLFSGIKVPSGASLNTVALNDYAFKATKANFFGNNAYVAVSLAGGPIPMDAGGPIRIVFDSNSKWFTNLDAWNWSLRTIEVL